MRLILIALLVAGTGWAQNKLDAKLDIKITNVEFKKTRLNHGYPQLPGPRAPSEWLRVDVAYDVEIGKNAKIPASYAKDLFLGECEFEWSVVFCSKHPESGNPNESRSVRMKKRIKYASIEVGDDHRAVLFIEPKTMERFKDRMIKQGIFVKVQVKSGGKTRAKAWARGNKSITKKSSAKGMFPKTKSGVSWFDSESVPLIKYGLLCRNESPWEYSLHSSFEYIFDCD